MEGDIQPKIGKCLPENERSDKYTERDYPLINSAFCCSPNKHGLNASVQCARLRCKKKTTGNNFPISPVLDRWIPIDVHSAEILDGQSPRL